MNITQYYQTKNRCYIAGRTIKPSGIVVHSTGANNAYIKRYVGPNDGILGENKYGNHWNSASANKCMHAFIGKVADGSVAIYQTLPWNYRSWGVGAGKKGSYNDSHIQFEICEDGLNNAAYYNEAFTAAKELCAYLCQLYGISTDNIVGHYEAYQAGYGSNHGDPKPWQKNFGDSMDQFRADVAAMIGTVTPEKAEQKPMQYIVSGTRLAMREGAGTSHDVLLRLDTGTEVTGTPVNAEWVKITYQGKTGYCMAKFLDAVAPQRKPETEMEPEQAEGEVIDMNTLRSGSRGTQVLVLQWLLERAGHSPGTADSIFGAKTLAAVKAYQAAKGLKADGIVGHDTWSKLLA